jgi:hypothetical protein
VRKILDDLGGPKVKIIAQIDCAEAIRNFDEINAASDGIMVSRVNLGMDLGPSKARGGGGGWVDGRSEAAPHGWRAQRASRHGAPTNQPVIVYLRLQNPHPISLTCPQVPLAQKWLIQKANLSGKPAFVAGQVGSPHSPRASRVRCLPSRLRWQPCVCWGVGTSTVKAKGRNPAIARLVTSAPGLLARPIELHTSPPLRSSLPTPG